MNSSKVDGSFRLGGHDLGQARLEILWYGGGRDFCSGWIHFYEV